MKNKKNVFQSRENKKKNLLQIVFIIFGKLISTYHHNLVFLISLS